MKEAQTWALVALLFAVFGGQLALTWKLVADLSSRLGGVEQEVARQGERITNLDRDVQTLTKAVMDHITDERKHNH